jgi:hypothetical protein
MTDAEVVAAVWKCIEDISASGKYAVLKLEGRPDQKRSMGAEGYGFSRDQIEGLLADVADCLDGKYLLFDHTKTTDYASYLRGTLGDLTTLIADATSSVDRDLEPL